MRAWSAAFTMRASAYVGRVMGPISIAPDGYGVVAGDASGAPHLLQFEVAHEDALDR